MRIFTVTHQKTNVFINWLKQQQYPITLTNGEIGNNINNIEHFEVTYNKQGWRRCRGLETVISRLKQQKALVQTGRGIGRKLYPTIDLDKYNSKTFDANSLMGLKGYNPTRRDVHSTVVRFVDVHLGKSNINKEMRYRQTYRTIYAQFALKTGIDLYEQIAIAESKTGKKPSKIEMVEKLGMIPQLFLIALQCLFNREGL
tara:strand:+ start:155 stop:754 length:600 start_codon:yes stop_codon:yes gene_type:complete